MSKKVLILSGSPRKGGNSDLLCDEFMRGAVEAGNEVTKIRIAEVKNKEFYYIVTCADTDKAAQETTLACFRGYADCVEGAEEKGVIYGIGVYQPGEIKKSPVFKQAYEMGKSVR